MHRHRSGGFTILELLVAISITVVIGAFALPEVGAWYEILDKQNAQIQVLQDLRLAQATTVEQGCQGVLTLDAAGESYTFGCDYVPFDSSPPIAADSNLFTSTLPPKVTISVDDQILFNSRGQIVDDQGFLSSRSVTLSYNESPFLSGTLSATGHFDF